MWANNFDVYPLNIDEYTFVLLYALFVERKYKKKLSYEINILKASVYDKAAIFWTEVRGMRRKFTKIHVLIFETPIVLCLHLRIMTLYLTLPLLFPSYPMVYFYQFYAKMI